MHMILFALSTLVFLVGVGLAVAVGVLLVQIGSFAAGARGQPQLHTGAPSPRGPLVVLVPAHDEARLIGGTVAGLRSQLSPEDRLLVVADNCSDQTASIARAHGAEVVERFSDLRGKGYALAHGLDHLRQRPPETVVVIDADCHLSAGGLATLAFTLSATGRPVQALYLMRAPDGAGFGRRISEFAWRVRNHLRPAGWNRWGFPCQLMGTGMAFSWDMLQDAPLANGSIVEDMKLGIDLACKGLAPVFCEDVLVTSWFPDSAAASASQRTRWEHGHIEMIFREVPAMVSGAMRRGDLRLFSLAMDLAVPPLALLSGLLMLGWFASLAIFWGGGGVVPLSLMSTVLLAFLVAVLLAWSIRGRDLIRFAELLAVPWYVASKVPVYVRFLIRRQKVWVRTDRD